MKRWEGWEQSWTCWKPKWGKCFERCTNCAILPRPLSRDHLCENWASLIFHFSAGERLQVNATSQCNDSGTSRCSKWPNDRMLAVVKHFWLLVQGRSGCRKRWLNTTTGQVFKKILSCSVARRVIVIAWFSWVCLKDQLGLCSSNCHTDALTGNCSAS